MSSSSSTEDATARPTLDGFEVESVLGRGPRGTVYVATQSGLGRKVALKLYGSAGRHDFGAWPEHPGVARLHAAGTTPDGGAFTATQLSAGGSLAARLAAEDIAREDALALCDDAEATLAALDTAHGALGAGNVLIDAGGGALLTDFGMAGADPSPAADRRALAALRARCEQLPPRGLRRRSRGAGVAAAALVAAGLAIALVTAGDDGASVPSALPGTSVVGSPLTGGAVTTLGCDGQPPSGSSPRCTVVPVRSDGRPLAFEADGVIRRWVVRGASGVVTLALLRRDAGDSYVVRSNAQPQTVSGPGVQAFAADLAVRRGDAPALVLQPGAGAGVVRGAGDTPAPVLRPGAGAGGVRGAGGADALSFSGERPFGRPRRVGPAAGAALAGRLELRVEVLPGGRARPVPKLLGAAARAAPPGRRIATREHEYPGVRVRTFALVALPGAVAIDLERGSTRLRRITVVGADPRGRVSLFDSDEVGAPGVVVTWVNPDGREVVHRYRASAGDISAID